LTTLPTNNWNSPKNVNSGETQEKPFSHRQRRKYVHGDSESDDQLQQPESPQLRPEGCITYFLIDFLLMCLSIDIDEVSPSEDEDAAQRALHGQHVNQQNGV